jgi:hypothetical protein
VAEDGSEELLATGTHDRHATPALVTLRS